MRMTREIDKAEISFQLILVFGNETGNFQLGRIDGSIVDCTVVPGIQMSSKHYILFAFRTDIQKGSQ